MTTPSKPRVIPQPGEIRAFPVLPLRDIVVFPHMIVPLLASAGTLAAVAKPAVLGTAPVGTRLTAPLNMSCFSLGSSTPS